MKPDWGSKMTTALTKAEKRTQIDRKFQQVYDNYIESNEASDEDLLKLMVLRMKRDQYPEAFFAGTDFDAEHGITAYQSSSHFQQSSSSYGPTETKQITNAEMHMNGKVVKLRIDTTDEGSIYQAAIQDLGGEVRDVSELVAPIAEDALLLEPSSGTT